MNLIKECKSEKKVDIDKLLSSWLTLEVLTPHSLPNKQELESMNQKIIELDKIHEPWNEEEFKKTGKETNIYWMVYVGNYNAWKAQGYFKHLTNYMPVIIDNEWLKG